MKKIEILCIGIIIITLFFSFKGVYLYFYGDLSDSEITQVNIMTSIAILFMILAGFELDKYYKS